MFFFAVAGFAIGDENTGLIILGFGASTGTGWGLGSTFATFTGAGFTTGFSTGFGCGFQGSLSHFKEPRFGLP